MKRAPKNMEEILRRYIPLASPEEKQSSCDRVRHNLQSPAASGVREELVLDFKLTPASVWRRVAMVSAAAALVLAAVTLSVRLWPGEAVAVVERGDARIELGQPIRTNGAGDVLRLADGSRIEVRAQSELSIERADDGVLIRLAKGSVIVSAAKQRSGHLYVRTKDMSVSVVGTVFFVSAESEGSRVAVIEGEVHVQQGATQKKLLPGEQLKTNPQMESLPVKDEVSWSRNAEVHVALLQQSAALPTAGSRREAFEEATIRPHSEIQVEGARGNNTTLLGCSAGPSQIDPRRFAINDMNVHTLVAMAYATPDNDCTVASMTGRLSGGPGWIRSEQFNIEAVMPEGTPSYTSQQFRTGNAPKLQMMLQTLLEDRFKARLHRETKDLPVFALTLGNAKDTAQFAKFAADSYHPSANEPRPGDPEFRNGVFGGALPGERLISGRNVSLDDLIPQLETYTGRPVVNRTGITGKFSFDLRFERVPDDVPTKGIEGLGRPLNSGSLGSLLKSIQEQLGLKLESTKAPVEVLIIDSVERPSDN